MKTLIVGKNSFLSKNLNLKNTIKISYNEVNDYNLNDFSKLILVSFPPKYKDSIEKDFKFEKKLFDSFRNKKIVYFSTQKVYAYKLNCSEQDELSPDSYYGENKLNIEKIIFNMTDKAQILRVSSVFSNNNFAKDSFFFQLKDNWLKKNKIIFNISLNSIKDFITINYLKIILDNFLETDEYGIFNIGSKNGISIRDLLSLIYKNLVPENIIELENQVRSRTLNNSKICTLLKLNPTKIHQETEKQISEFNLF
jgi:dTDP-4-dehydrorhamnose reductase